MPDTNLSHRRAALLALLVTFLWSTSWVLIKIGLRDVPALTFAGLRYGLAFLILLPWLLRPAGRRSVTRLGRSDRLNLLTLGLVFYGLTQGAQFLGLALLPALTVSLLLNFTTLVVAGMSFFMLDERLGRRQWAGVAACLAGVLIYFWPGALAAQESLGLLVVVVGVAANAYSAVLGRRINRQGHLQPLTVTTISMGIGATALLLAGIPAYGWPDLDLNNWLIIGWLALVNTAFAFTLWNYTLRVLTAVEASIINSTMLVQIAGLAWLFLGEEPGLQKIAGMVLVGLGALVVQVSRSSIEGR